MSLNRTAKRRDSNEPSIRDELERHGLRHRQLSIRGVCDLLVAGDHTLLVEVKTPDGEVNDDQLEFLFEWPGTSGVARTPEEALEICGYENNRFAGCLDMGFADACRIAALHLALPEQKPLNEYIRARVAYISQKGRKKAFTGVLEDEHCLVIQQAIPKAFVWQPDIFWELFERVVAKGWIRLPQTLLEQDERAVRNQMTRWSASGKSLYMAQTSFRYETSSFKDLYEKVDIQDQFRPLEEWAL